MTEQKKEPIKLVGRAMNLADYEFARYGARVPAGTTLEDVLNPVYLANYTHLKEMKPGSQVDLISDDLTLDVSLRVQSVTPTTIRCRPIRSFYDDGKGDEEVPDGYEVSFAPAHRFRFKHNDRVVETGFADRASAISAAKLHARANLG